MDAIQINLFTLLGAMEFVLVLAAAACLLWLHSRRLARHAQALQARLDQPVEAPEAVGFDQYLRDEVIRNQAFIEEATASADADDREAAQLLQMRKQFLELELEAHPSAGNPVDFRHTLAGGMRALIEQLRPEPEVRVEAVVESAPAAVEDAHDDAQDGKPGAARESRDTREEEIDHLRQVINNQQDAMARLRAGLKDSDGEIEGMDDILEKLEEFERRSRELQQSLEVLEAENERLKHARRSGDSTRVELVERDPAQLTGLKTMVGKQQATISTLRDLVRELAPEASKARELQEAIAEIQRTNEELNGCVAVLEDENAMLREELGEIQAYLDRQEKEREAAAQSVQEPDDAAPEQQSPQEAMREMEIKVQELEALVEFKDAAIEEMEKQYNALQAKYLAATGKKKID